MLPPGPFRVVPSPRITFNPVSRPADHSPPAAPDIPYLYHPLTMPSERVQRRVDRLLDQAEEAVEALDWSRVREVAGSILVVDPDNDDARSFLAMAEHNLVDAPLRTRRRLLPLTQAPQFLPRRLPVRPHSPERVILPGKDRPRSPMAATRSASSSARAARSASTRPTTHSWTGTWPSPS